MWFSCNTLHVPRTSGFCASPRTPCTGSVHPRARGRGCASLMVTSSGSGPSARTRGSRTCHPAGCGPTHGPSARGGQQVFVDLNTTPGSSAAQRGSSFSQKHTPSIGLSALCGVSPLASPPRASGCAVHPQRAEGIAEHFDQTIAEGSIRTRGGDRDGRRHLHDLRAIRVGDGAASFVHTPASYHHVGSSAHARPWTASGCLDQRPSVHPPTRGE